MTIYRVYAQDYYNQPYANTAECFDTYAQAQAYKEELKNQGFQYVAVETDKI